MLGAGLSADTVHRQSRSAGPKPKAALQLGALPLSSLESWLRRTDSLDHGDIIVGS